MMDIAFLQYASGLASTPKGVVISHANLMANAGGLEEGMPVNEDDIY
jgi:long-subunit acyl-CoA synthetase (AMP-forming)